MTASVIRAIAAASIIGASSASAQVASINIPSFTLSGPPSTGTVCTPTAAASGLASAAPAGTIIFNCVVSPVGWVTTPSGITINDPALRVVNISVPSTASAPTFSLALVAAGVAQTYPAGTGATAP